MSEKKYTFLMLSYTDDQWRWSGIFQNSYDATVYVRGLEAYYGSMLVPSKDYRYKEGKTIEDAEEFERRLNGSQV